MPRRVLAEMEVEADHGAGDGEAVDQNALDEVLGAEPRQRRVEGEHDRAVEPGRGQQPELGGLRGEVERGLVRAEERARMRLEGEHRRRPVRRLGALHRRADHRAVAAMHAVEIADGDHRPDQPVEAGQSGPRRARRRRDGRDSARPWREAVSVRFVTGVCVNDTLTDLP